MNVLDHETALVEFDRWAKSMDLDPNKEEDKGEITTVVEAIQTGAIIINTEGCLVFTPQRSKNKDPIKFRESTGADVLATDKRDKAVGKMFLAMAQLTSTSPRLFSDMKRRDLRVCMAVFTLLMT